MSQLRLLGEPPAGADHAALANLSFPQTGHTGFVAAAGLAGGQTIIGGIAAGENLILQSTAHAARGQVRLQDDLQLLSNLIRDSAGTRRLSLAAASPNVILGNPAGYGGGDTLITGKLGLGNTAPAVDAAAVLNITGAGGTPTCGCLVQQGLTAAVPSTETWGLGGLCAFAPTSGAANLVAGLRFTAYYAATNSATLAALEAIRIQNIFASQSTTLITAGAGLHVLRPAALSGSYRRPDTQYGVYIENQYSAAGYNTPTNVYGLKIDDITGGTNPYLLELGPATPYLRLAGNGGLTSQSTNLYLADSSSLKRVQWKNFSSLLAGDNVMIMV